MKHSPYTDNTTVIVSSLDRSVKILLSNSLGEYNPVDIYLYFYFLIIKVFRAAK